jgi:hypothetical protein
MLLRKPAGETSPRVTFDRAGSRCVPGSRSSLVAAPASFDRFGEHVVEGPAECLRLIPETAVAARKVDDLRAKEVGQRERGPAGVLP